MINHPEHNPLVWRRIRAWAVEHQPFLLLLVAFSVFRLLAILFLRPGGFVTEAGPDQTYYFAWSRFSGSGLWPYFNFWVEYPPLMPWLASLAYQLSLQIPVWDIPIFWFNLIFRLMLLPFDMGTLGLVYASALQLGPRERAMQVAGLWVLLFAPLATLLAWFEPMAAFFLLLGLYGLLSDRPALAGAAIGLGFMVKAFPIVLVPIGLFTLTSHRRRAMFLGAAALSAGLVMLPPLILAPQFVLANLGVLGSVPSTETIWALLDGYLGPGSVPSLAARTDPALAAIRSRPSPLPWPLISLGFAVAYIFLLTRRIDWKDKTRVTLLALFSLLFLMLYSKAYSPQWALSLGTLALLALPIGRGLGYALLLDVYMLAEWPIAYILLDGQADVTAVVIVLRTILMILLGLDCLVRVLPIAASPAGNLIRQATFPLALVLSVVGGCALAVPAGQAYTATRLKKESLAPALALLHSDSSSSGSIITIQPDVFERMRPFLPGDTIHLLPNFDGRPWTDVEAWLSATLASKTHAWLFYNNYTDEAYQPLYDQTRAWFDTQGCPALQTWYGTIRAEQYVVAPAAPEQVIEATFGDGLRLVSATPPPGPVKPGDAFCVRLRWKPVVPLPADHAIFLHLLAEDGRLVAQSDLWPATPTSAWSGEDLITTKQGLIAPADLTPGGYVLRAGLYDGGGTRLRLADGNDSVVLATLTVEKPFP